MTGLSSSEVYIQPDVAAMAALNIKPDDFKRIIEDNNLIYGNVTALDGVLQYNVSFSADRSGSVADIQNLVFSHHDRVFRLKEIAKIGLREKNRKGAFIAHNQQAINLAIIKHPDTKLDELRKATSVLIDEMERDYPEISFEQTQDQTELLEFSISNLKQDLLSGSLLAFILMFFFLRNMRAPILIGITIPLSLILSILFFNLIGLTINIISLSGLVLAVGLMIDNSIIVIDNITQLRDRGASLTEACVKGATEVIRPLLSSVFTTCSVFLPLIFLSGISGALFYDQAMAISIGLAISLIISITILPVLYRLFHQGNIRSFDHDFFERYGINFFERMYESGFRWTFNHKKSVFLIVTGLMVANVLLFIALKKEKLPALEQTELLTTVDWNRNITIEENTRRVKDLIASLGKEVKISNAMIGEQQYLLNKDKELSSSEALIYLKANESPLIEDFKIKIKEYLEQKYPEASWKLNPPKSIFEQVFGEDQAPLIVKLAQNGEQSLPDKQQIARIEEAINKHDPQADIYRESMQTSLALHLHSDKLLLYKLSPQQVYERLRSGLNANEISVLQQGRQQLPIVLGEGQQDLVDVIQTSAVKNNNGSAYPLSELIRVDKQEAYKTLQGGLNGNYLPISVETAQPQEMINALNQEFKGQSGLNIDYSGSYFSNRKLIEEMAIVLLVAVLLLYFILASQFESLVQPLIVLFELPISMSGALILLYFCGSSINLISLIGLVVMCGIIINDSILKIDTINQLRRHENYELLDAIHIGGIRRLKSIVMTSMTTILSVTPFLFGSDMGSLLQRPLSLALIGGMLIGTPVSLYFIPLVYWFYYRKKPNSVTVNHQENLIVN
jgi:multidrug efflux pump subunit AcrB